MKKKSRKVNMIDKEKKPGPNVIERACPYSKADPHRSLCALRLLLFQSFRLPGHPMRTTRESFDHALQPGIVVVITVMHFSRVLSATVGSAPHAN